MHRAKSWRGAAQVAHQWRLNSTGRKPWLMRWKPVCASTEKELSDWLKAKPFQDDQPRAFFAGRQVFGRGQYGRVWESKLGGVWTSAAIPVSGFNQPFGLFSLAIAVSLCQRIENKGLDVQIKWPNDLIVNRRKLAGFLPTLVNRGNLLKLIRVGVGLNVTNKVPDQGISLGQVLGSFNCDLAFWSAEVLLALEIAMDLVKDRIHLLDQVETRMWAKEIIDKQTGKEWSIKGLDFDGRLIVSNGSSEKRLTRWM